MKTLYYLFKDGATLKDFYGKTVTLFKAPWYRVDRWIWWLFICGSGLSRFEWSLIDSNGQAIRGYYKR